MATPAQRTRDTPKRLFNRKLITDKKMKKYQFRYNETIKRIRHFEKSEGKSAWMQQIRQHPAKVSLT